MSATDPILAAALLGTGRAPWRVPDVPEPLAGWLRSLPVHESEGALLQAVALTRLHQQAGAEPLSPALAAAAPCESETQPQVPVASASLLPELLMQGRDALLEEWLALASARGYVAAPAVLPLLLDLGSQRVALRPAIAALTGARGRWLAGQNPDWAWHGATLPDADWDTASTAARVLLLRTWRESDAAMARERVAAGWKQSSADERAALLQALETGLSLEDEPFLEAALDDRSVGVRRAAASLLSQLPGSALAARIAARMLPLVTVEKRGLLRRAVLEVKLLEAADAALERDGVETGVRQAAGTGERTHWTRQALAKVPPARWVEHLKLSPEALINAADQGDWKDLMVGSWLEAAARFRDLDWARALSRAVPAAVGQSEGLMRLLPAEAQEEIVVGLLSKIGETGPTAPLTALLASRFDWSDRFTEYALSQIESYQGKAYTDTWTHQQLSQRIIRTHITRMPLHFAASPDASELRQDLARLLHLRGMYHAAFAPEGSQSK